MTALNKTAITQAILLTSDEQLKDCIRACRFAVAAIHHSAEALDLGGLKVLAGQFDTALISAQDLSVELHRQVAVYCAEMEFARDIEFRNLKNGPPGDDTAKIIEHLANRRSLKNKD